MKSNNSWAFTVAFGAMLAVLGSGPSVGLAQAVPAVGVGNPVPPPLSRTQAEHYRAHPAEWNRLLDRLPKVKNVPQTARSGSTRPPLANTWTRTSSSPPESGLGNPLLMTDGTVIVHITCSTHWYKLTPDSHGSYIDGTWSAIASTAADYAPLYFASQILNDGRVVMNGGEYSNGCQGTWTNKGAIYNPVSNSWASVSPPTGWTTIGDAQSIILPNAKYMLANCCSTESAIFNSTTLTWTPTGTGKFDSNNEEGWALLHDGSVLTTDAYVGTGTCGLNSERYKSGAWTTAGTVTTQLSDCLAVGNHSFEVGPLVVRPNGTTVAFSAVTTGVAGTSIRTTAGAWHSGPPLPTIAGGNYNLADAPAVALPNGNVLFAASPGLFNTPAHFFEFTRTNTIVQRADTPGAPFDSGYVVNFLQLPNGQVLQTDFSNDVEIYTPGGSPLPSWRPVVSSVPSILTRGNTFQLSGVQLTGITHGVYGDDQQAATNFPLVRLTDTVTGNVYYAKTSNFSTRSDKPGVSSTAKFSVPGVISMPAGTYSLVAIANGIASDPVSVIVN